MTAQTVTHPSTLASYETLAQVLHDAGFDDEELLHAVTVLDDFVLGSALDAGAPVEVWADSGRPDSALSRAIRATKAQPGDRLRPRVPHRPGEPAHRSGVVAGRGRGRR